ncbi:MAG: NAD-dependent epimerase/dehydratase family protein [Telluria sp.]
MNRVMITGASGFVGAALSRRLVQDGYEVHALLREGSDAPAGVTAHRHDGSTRQLAGILQGVQPRGVFHLASLFLAQHSVDDVEGLVASNILFGTQLAEAMCMSGTRLLVNAGTAWQHNRDAQYDPVNLYAATKQAFEAVLAYYANAHGLRVATLKLSDTYGPGDTRRKLPNLLKHAAQTGEPLAMSPGEQFVDLVYIDDVADAFARAWELLRDGAQAEAMAAYAVSSGAPVQLRALAALYARVTGCALNIEWGGRAYRPREVMVPWTRGACVPGWRPQVGLEEGIARFHNA